VVTRQTLALDEVQPSSLMLNSVPVLPPKLPEARKRAQARVEARPSEIPPLAGVVACLVADRSLGSLNSLFLSRAP
jgi:hypothetical protein